MFPGLLQKAGIYFLVFLLPLQGFTQLKPGDIAKDAVTIDARLSAPFMGGLAIIQKGTKKAIINMEGKIVFPFSDVIITQVSAPSNGMYIINGTDDNGKYISRLINNKGETIIDLAVRKELTLIEMGSNDCVGFKTRNRENFYVYPNGEIVKFDVQLSGITEGIGIEIRSDGSAYWNLKEKKIIPGKFHRVLPFSNGIGIVGVMNEFNQIVYGAIDKEGNIVLPIKFNNIPETYSNNFTVIQPKDKSEFDYAYFNNRGTMVKTVKRSAGSDQPQGSFFKNRFVRGNANGETILFDSTWKKTTLKNLLAEHHVDVRKYVNLNFGITLNIRSNIGATSNGSEEDDNIMWYSGSEMGKQSYAGFINFGTGKSVPPIFNWQSMMGKYIKDGSYGTNLANNYFDPVSKLAFVSMPVKFDDRGLAIEFRNGFIDEDGIFRIILGSSSQW